MMQRKGRNDGKKDGNSGEGLPLPLLSQYSKVLVRILTKWYPIRVILSSNAVLFVGCKKIEFIAKKIQLR